MNADKNVEDIIISLFKLLLSPVIRDENSVPMHSFDSILYGGGRTRVQSKAALEDSVVIFLKKSTLMNDEVSCVWC